MVKSFTRTAKQERERAEFENFLRISGRSFDSFRSAEEPGTRIGSDGRQQRYISINRLIDFSRSYWQAARAGWVKSTILLAIKSF